MSISRQNLIISVIIVIALFAVTFLYFKNKIQKNSEPTNPDTSYPTQTKQEVIDALKEAEVPVSTKSKTETIQDLKSAVLPTSNTTPKKTKEQVINELNGITP